MENQFILLALITLGIVSHSNTIAVASAILLITITTPLSRYLSVIEKYGLDMGLLFLTLYILIPLIKNRDILFSISETITSPIGILSVVAGALATILNGQGINLLNNMPQLILGIIIGSLIGVTFLGGIPVGPLMSGAILVMILYLLNLFGIYF
ncbi:DUF441 domain-containing protein [Calorimonas adulescens]|uniref:UPF0756 membrane protein FWJ32_10040 n=1 Tax=Calorimonas adulescens TaxID=2606906 RepID=A0A5D8QBN5_9THEO|nr:DUF441 family protein [Calorimonas adulescens]TZE81206.1 DUF441 domain-containing protein [Calorimonas adulescens]